MSDVGQGISFAEALYIEGREGVHKAIHDTPQETLDWRGPNGRSQITIASQLVHIAGFDSMVREAVLGNNVDEVVHDPAWLETYGSGFPRELGVEPPEGRSAQELLSALDEETQLTIAAMRKLVGEDVDPYGVVDFYEDGREFQREALVAHQIGMLVLYVPAHDRYHRGQMAQMRYFHAQTT